MKKMEHVIFLCQEDCWKGVEKSCFYIFPVFLDFSDVGKCICSIEESFF